MPISKVSSLSISYKHFVVEVKRNQDHLIQGILYHDDGVGGIVFDSQIRLMQEINARLDQLKAPMQSMRFRGREGTDDCDRFFGGTECFDVESPCLAVFYLHIRYRYNATWQGELAWVEENRRFGFNSFLEALFIMNHILENGCVEQSRLDQELKTGSLRLVLPSQLFIEEDIAGKAAHSSYLKRGTGSMSVLEVLWGRNAATSFVIRILFRRNATVQGTICWLDERRKGNFRSFMELINMMLSAMQENGTESEETVGLEQAVSI